MAAALETILMRPRTVAELRAEARALWHQADELERAELEYGSSTAWTILTAVGQQYHVDPARIMGKLKRSHVAAARHCAMWMLRQLTPLSLPKIGLVLQRDHSTIVYGINRIEARMLTSPPFAAEIVRLRERIRLSLLAVKRGVEGTETPLAATFGQGTGYGHIGGLGGRLWRT